MSSQLNLKELFKSFWIFYRFDKINENIDKNTEIKQKINFCFITPSTVLVMLYFTVLAFVNNQVPIKQLALKFDIMVHLGERPNLTYYAIILCTIFSLLLSLLLNHSKCSDYKWFEIIDDFNKFEKFPKIGFNDNNLIDSYIIKISNMSKIVKTSLYLGNIIANIMFLSIIYMNFDLILIHIWFTSLFTFSSITYIIYKYINYSFLYFFIICYNSKLRISQLNKFIMEQLKKKTFTRIGQIFKLPEDFNEIVSDIYYYNKFWKRYILIVYYIITPFNLLILEIARSDNMKPIVRILSMVMLFSTIIMGLFFNLFISSINEEFNKFYKNINEFYAKNNLTSSLRLKLKLMNAMERCGERRRLIGFSCGDQFVITRQIAFKMFIIFFRFTLLTRKLSSQ